MVGQDSIPFSAKEVTNSHFASSRKEDLTTGIYVWGSESGKNCFIPMSIQCKNVCMHLGTETEQRHELETEKKQIEIVPESGTGSQGFPFFTVCLNCQALHRRSGMVLPASLIPVWSGGKVGIQVLRLGQSSVTTAPEIQLQRNI